MIQIVFQNNNFVVCNKPAEVLSVPAREKNDPRLCLGLLLQEELKTQIFPVHRLDYETSGLIIYALHAKSHQQSQKWFLDKNILKTYHALTTTQNFSHWPENINTDRSVIESASGFKAHWKTQMMRGKRRSFESQNGEWAETLATIENIQNTNISWLLNPLTGKPHQLRFELSRRGFPILGDQLYGSKAQHSGPGLALRAIKLDLTEVKDRLGLPPFIEIEGFSIF